MNQVSNDDDDDGCIRLGKAKKSGFYDPFSKFNFFVLVGGGGGGGGEFKSGFQIQESVSRKDFVVNPKLDFLRCVVLEI